MNFRCLAGAASALVCFIFTAPSHAQVGSFQGQGGPAGQFNRQGNRAQQRQQPRNYLTELKAIAETLGKKAEVKIVVDPALFVASKPTDPADGVPVEKALDQLAAAIRGSAWRRVYLHATQATVLPPADKLAASVRTLDQLDQSGLVLENPATKRATTFVKNYAVTPGFAEELQAGQFATAPVYVFYAQSVSTDAKSPEERFADLQRQQMEMMMSMSPDQLQQAMQNSMQMFMNMDPGVRQQMMGTMMKAGMQMFMNMPPDQRNQLLQSFIPQGGFPGGPPRP